MKHLLGKQPDYSLLCTFGCACWPNLRPYITHKLAFRSTCCVFLGYNNQHKGYKCLDSSFGQMYISRDVIFYEIVFPFSTLHPNVGALLKSKISLLHPTLRIPHEGVRVEEFNVTNVANAPHESFAEIGDLAVSNSEQDQRFVISDASHTNSGAIEDLVINPRADSKLMEAISDLGRIVYASGSVLVSTITHGSASYATPERSSADRVAMDEI
jgi:hypothetical protein